jgi:DinB family protein
LAGVGESPREEIDWPGDGKATTDWLCALRSYWIAVLDGFHDANLASPAHFPWRDDPDKTVSPMVAWVNSELMKNSAGIGQLRLLRAASAEIRS